MSIKKVRERKMEEIKKILETAISRFNETDKYLIENDLSERCICSRFAFHIQQALIESEFHEYIADVEYNRGSEGKEKNIKVLRDKKIVVDLIVHKRGYFNDIGFDNLFCVEMKKSSSRYGYDDDKQRLKDMTDIEYGYNYKRGYMIVADMKNNKLVIESEFLLNF